MKVVLREDVDNLGKKGDLIEVADGYARNFLVPRGMALKASVGIEKQADAMRRNRDAHDKRDREAAEAIAAQVSGKTITIAARAGVEGKLFGSVGTVDVADAVQAQLGVEIDRRKVVLSEPLKELGPAEVPVRLHADVTAMLAVDVVAQD